MKGGAMYKLVLCFLLLALQISYAETRVRRSFSKNPVYAADTLRVSLHIDLDSVPAALIINEYLPEGLVFMQASWNNKVFQPLRQGNQLRWLFAALGTQPSSGILSYSLQLDESRPLRLEFFGTFESSLGRMLPIDGDWELLANMPKLETPAFFPESGTVFEEELLVSIQSSGAADEEIYFCLGDWRYWQNWQPYQGPFYIRHSEQVTAELWHEASQSNIEARSEYWRRCAYSLQWQAGWNLLGLPLILPANEWEKLAGEEIRELDCEAAPAFWLYASKAGSLRLCGLEPIVRGLVGSAQLQWQLITPQGLEALHTPKGVFYEWRQQAFQQTELLLPGKSYYAWIPH